MTVRVSQPDQYPYVVGVYRCKDCGATVEQHGRHADELPQDWVRAGDDDVLCWGCVPAAPTP